NSAAAVKAIVKWQTKPITADVQPISNACLPKNPRAMLCKMRKGVAPSRPKAMNAWVRSPRPAKRPPQKMAKSGRDGTGEKETAFDAIRMVSDYSGNASMHRLFQH